MIKIHESKAPYIIMTLNYCFKGSEMKSMTMFTSHLPCLGYIE